MLHTRPRRPSSTAPHRQISLIILAWLSALACAVWAAMTGLNWLNTFAAARQSPTTASHDTDPLMVATRIRSAGLFSHQSASSPVAERTDAEAADMSGARLHGIATGFHGGSAFALLSIGDRSAAYREGEEIERGWRLRKILADRVELEGAGLRATVLLFDPASLTPPRATGPAKANDMPEPQPHDD